MLNFVSMVYVLDMEAKSWQNKGFTSLPASSDAMSSADNLCNQFESRSGPTEHQS